MHTCRYIEQKMEGWMFLLKDWVDLKLGFEEIQISLCKYRSIFFFFLKNKKEEGKILSNQEGQEQ